MLETRSEAMWAMDSSLCVPTMTLIFRELSKQSVLRHTLDVSRGQKRGWDRKGMRLIDKRELKSSVYL